MLLISSCGENTSGADDETEPQMSYLRTEMIWIRQDKTEMNQTDSHKLNWYDQRPDLSHTRFGTDRLQNWLITKKRKKKKKTMMIFDSFHWIKNILQN